MEEKIRKKIQKLLALAQSDNAHEAERARVQAEKMMSKYSVNADALQVTTTQAKAPVRRKKLKDSEALLTQIISRISATHTLYVATRKPGGGYVSKIQFMGLEPDAEMAAYTWDVLYRQLLKRQSWLKSEYQLNAHALERYSLAWVKATIQQIARVFPLREPSAETTRLYKALDTTTLKTIKGRKSGRDDFDEAVEYLGYAHGEEASLHQAAGAHGPAHKRLGVFK